MQMVLPIFDGTRQLCNAPGCDKSTDLRRGFCRSHHRRLSLYGDPLLSWNDVKPPAPQCSIDECTKEAWARGYCSNHYGRLRRYGRADEPDHRVRQPDYVQPKCVVEGCENDSRLLGMCNMHAHRMKRHGNPNFVLRQRISQSLPAGSICQIAECQRLQKAKGYCARHYNREYRANNRMAATVFNQKRRARKRSAFVCDYTPEQVHARMAYWGNKCWMCGGPFECIDHVKPLSKGGKDCPANFRPSCLNCNSQKNAKWYGVHELHRFIKT